MTSGHTREEGAVFQLLPGVYNLVVEDQSQSKREKKEMNGVKVEADKVQIIDIQF